VQLVREELRVISPFDTRLATSEVQASPVLQGGLEAGLVQLRGRLFGDGARTTGGRRQAAE
jgi:hypothetical protein